MSASVYGLVFKATIGNPSTKLVLLALADNSNDDGYCYPGVKHLMRKCELGKRQILRHLDKLEDEKIIRRQSGGCGKGDTSEFWLDLELLKSRVSPTTPCQGKGVFQDALRVSSVSDPPIPPNREEPSLKPSTTSGKNHRRTKDEIFEPFSEDTKYVVNTVLMDWPTKRPGDNSKIEVDLAMFASRVGEILKNPKVTPMLLVSAARRYIVEKKPYPHAPQFFFGPGKNGDPPWRAYARLEWYEAQQKTMVASVGATQ